MYNESKAIPFIIKKFDSSTYQLTPEAQNFLSNLNTPLSVVTVAGLYRTGKSYLLNRVILKRGNGFGVGPTVNPCTKGLWLWKESITTSDNKQMLVIDTEGLGALDQEANHDMKIFCLAVLLSSTFIYNSMGNIDESALQTLSLVLNLVEDIDSDNFSNRPSFIWVVRDFSLQLVDDKGRSITSKQYLELALSTENLKQTQKINLRKTITNAFSQRDCFTLVKPLIDEGKLQCLQSISEDELRAQFNTQTMLLRKKIQTSLKEIKLNSKQPLRGKEYVIMIKKYLSAINNGKVPNMLDTWTFIKQEKARAVAQEMKARYSEKITSRLNNKFPMTSTKLNEFIHSIRSQMLEEYTRQCYDNTSTSQIQAFLSNTANELHRFNQKQSKRQLTQLLKREYDPFYKKLLSAYYSDFEKFESDVRNSFKDMFIEKYLQKMDGVVEIAESFTDKKINDGLKFFNKKAQDQIGRLQTLKNDIENTLQNELKNVKMHADEEKRRFQEEIYSLERRLILINNQKAQIQEESAKGRLEDQISYEKTKKRSEQAQQTIEQLMADISKTQAVSAELEKKAFIYKKELEKEKALFSQKEEHFAIKCNQLERKYNSLHTEFQKIGIKFQTEKKELCNNFQLKIAQLLKQNSQKLDQIHELENKLQNEKHLRHKIQKETMDLRSKYASDIQNYKQKLQDSSKKQLKNFQLEQVKAQFSKFKEFYEKSVCQLKDSQLKCKQLNEQIKIIKINNDNMQAIHVQKIEFQQLQINELKTKNIELNRSYQKALQGCHIDNKNVQQIYQRKMNDAADQNQRAIKLIEQQYQQKIKQIRKQIVNSNKSKEDLALQINLQRKKQESKEKQMKDAYRALELMYQGLNQKYSSSERDFNQINKEKESYYMIRVKQLEQEIENTKEKSAQYIEENQKKSEQALTILKNYSEMQRQQWQKRLEDQRQKSSKRQKSLKQEYQRRLSQEKQTLEDTISELQDKLVDVEQICNEKLSNLKYDYDIKIQKISNQAMQERMDLTKKNALLSQQIDLSKISFENQMQERKRYYQKNIQTVKRQLMADNEQNMKKMKEQIDFLENKFDNLKKSSRKIEQANFMLKSEIDKEKALIKEKEHHFSLKIRQLQTKLSEEMISYSKSMEQAHNAKNKEINLLNTEIEKLKDMNFRLDDDKNKMQSEHEHQIMTLNTKNNFLESRFKRSKEDYEDLLKKFQLTVKNLSNNKDRSEIHKQYEENRARLKADCQRKIKEKEEEVEKEMKETNEKILRLQTQNKSLRDRILLFEVKNANSRKTNNEDIPIQEVQRMKEQYQKKIYEYKNALQRQRRQSKKLKDDKESMEMSIRLQRSRLSNKSQRNSFINELPHPQQGGYQLMENRNIINRKLTNLPTSATSVKKQQKGARHITLDEPFEGIMRFH